MYAILTWADSGGIASVSRGAARRSVGSRCCWCRRSSGDSPPSPWSSPACGRRAEGFACAPRVAATLGISWAHGIDDDGSRWAGSSGVVQTCPNLRRCCCYCCCCYYCCGCCCCCCDCCCGRCRRRLQMRVCLWARSLCVFQRAKASLYCMCFCFSLSVCLFVWWLVGLSLISFSLPWVETTLILILIENYCLIFFSINYSE